MVNWCENQEVFIPVPTYQQGLQMPRTYYIWTQPMKYNHTKFFPSMVGSLNEEKNSYIQWYFV
jgi:hypothetical protein